MPAGRPSSRAVSSSARRQPVAPSLRPAELPAVTRPCGRNEVFNVASFSTVVPGRGGSSCVARPQPSAAERVATGTSWTDVARLHRVRELLLAARGVGVAALLGDLGE